MPVKETTIVKALLENDAGIYVEQQKISVGDLQFVHGDSKND